MHDTMAMPPNPIGPYIKYFMLSPENTFIDKTQMCSDNLRESANVTSHNPSHFELVLD